MSQPPRRVSSDSPQHFGRGLAGILARTEAYKTGNAAEPAPTPPPEPAAAPALEMAPPHSDPPTPRRNQPPRHVAEQQNKPGGSGRVHPDRRGGLVLGTALAEVRGGAVSIPDALSYYSPELIQATLPHSDPKIVNKDTGEVTKARDWIRKNGDFTLTVTSGIDQTGKIIGIPYGVFPRHVLAYIITQIIDRQDNPAPSGNNRIIKLDDHWGTFLKAVGYTGNNRGKHGQAMRDNMLRLFRANLSFFYDEGSPLASRNMGYQMHVAPKFDLWWSFKEPEQGSLFNSWIEISEDFYKAILARPVPLRTDILRALHPDVMAIDVYMWASYRLFGMKDTKQDSLRVSYAALQAQFGTGIAEENYRKFRQTLRRAFAKVADKWKPLQGGQSALKYEFIENGVVLYDSPLTVPRGNRKTQNEEAAAMLAARRFDSKTRDKARVLAATRYTVDYLEEQYFAWIEQKKFIPTDPPAHFIDFVNEHIIRNR